MRHQEKNLLKRLILQFEKIWKRVLNFEKNFFHTSNRLFRQNKFQEFKTRKINRFDYGMEIYWKCLVFAINGRLFDTVYVKPSFFLFFFKTFTLCCNSITIDTFFFFQQTISEKSSTFRLLLLCSLFMMREKKNYIDILTFTSETGAIVNTNDFFARVYGANTWTELSINNKCWAEGK